MKKRILILLSAVLFLSSCGGIKTSTFGLENESFIEFIGRPSDYSDGIDVKIDENISFKAVVNKDSKRNVVKAKGGKAYVISTGTHTLIVSYKNNVILKKQIFVSAQETKKIILP
jgi:hypothetical protein